MCIFCKIVEQRAADERAKQAQSSGNGAPGQTEAQGVDLSGQFEKVELEQRKASINATIADAVSKLSKSITVLTDAGYYAQADQVAILLREILPPLPAPEAQPVEPAPATAPVDEFAGVPATVLEYVQEMRKQGFVVELVRFPL